MRRIGLGLTVLAVVVAAALLATCDRDEQIGSLAATAPRAATSGRVGRPPRSAVVGEVPEAAGADPAATPPDRSPRGADLTINRYEGRIAAPKHLLRGRVVDAQGKPLAGCQVELVSAWLPSDVMDRFVGWPPEAEATIATDTDGRFELPYWEGGRRELRVSDPDGNARWRERDVGDDRDVEIVLSERNADVVVRTVSAADGTLVKVLHVTIYAMPVYDMPGVSREILGEQGSDECSVSNGVHRFEDVPAGPAVLEVSVNGYAPVRRWIRVADQGEQVIDVPLVAGRTLRGWVVDAETGRGIPNADVAAGYLGHLSARTDSDGRFVLEHVPAEPGGFQAFEAGADSYAPTRFLADGTEGAEFVVRLPKPASLRARCVDPSGAPLPHAVFVASSDYDASPPGGARSTTSSVISEFTDEAGRIDLRDFVPGTEGLELRTRLYLDGVLVLERSYPRLVAGETRDLGDVVLPEPPRPK